MRCNVPSPILKKCSRLASLWSPFSMNLSLENVSQGVGHVLVHHLFTGTYQSLKPKGESRYEIADYLYIVIKSSKIMHTPLVTVFF
jgi:hypothetical protein